MVCVRIIDIRSSLNDLARLANLVPFKLFLWPDDPVVLLPTSGVLDCWVGVAGEVFGEPYRFDCDDRDEFGVDGVLMTLSIGSTEEKH